MQEYKYKFKEYKDESFRDFVHEIFDLYELRQIRFSPHQGKSIFTTFQLEHIAPNWEIQHPKSFLYAWSQHRDVVRVVTLEMFCPNESLKVRMTINLDKKLFVLEQLVGISSEEVVSILKRHFSIKDVTSLEKIREIIVYIFISVVALFIFFLVFSGINWLDTKAARDAGISKEPNLASKIIERVFTSNYPTKGSNIGNDYGSSSINQYGNVSSNLSADEKQNYQYANMSISHVTWWKDTLWGIIIVGVFIGIIIAFLVYIFGWNA